MKPIVLLDIHSSYKEIDWWRYAVLRPFDIPSGSETLSHMTSFPLPAFPDHQSGLFLRADAKAKHS
jgi:hypothetical protein